MWVQQAMPPICVGQKGWGEMIEISWSLVLVLGLSLALGAIIFYFGYLVGEHKGWERGWAAEKEHYRKGQTIRVLYPTNLEEAEAMNKDRGER